MCGCGSSPTDNVGRLVAEESKQKAKTFVITDYGRVYDFKYVVIDKHEYLVSTFDRGIGLTHSPKCWCLNN